MVQITNYTSPNYTDRPQVNIQLIENYFTAHDFWATCAWPEKTELPNWIYFLHSELALALKTFSLEFFTVLNIFFTIQDFWATLCLPWKTEGALNSLHWIYIFIIHEFWVTCTCPEIFQARWGGLSPRPPASYAYAASYTQACNQGAQPL